jgi:hypothetical protein
VVLRDPTSVEKIRIVRADTGSGALVQSGVVRLGDGSERRFTFREDDVEVDLDGTTTRIVQIEIRDVVGLPAVPVSIAEVTIDDLDLREYRSAPESLVERAGRNDDLQDRLATSPLVISFERDRGERGRIFESVMRRRFRLASARSFVVQGDVLADALDATVEAQLDDTVGGGCTDTMLQIDGEAVPVRVSRTDDAFAFAGCAPLRLAAGHHDVDSGAFPLDRVVLRSERVGELEDASPTDPAIVTTQAFDGGWRASIGRIDLGEPVPIDAMTAFIRPGDGDGEFEMQCRSERLYDVALLTTAVAVVISAVLAFWPRRRRQR